MAATQVNLNQAEEDDQLVVSTATYAPIISLPQSANNYQVILDPSKFQTDYQIVVEFLKHHPINQALTLSNPNVPEIYIQEMWQTIEIKTEDLITGDFTHPNGVDAVTVPINRERIARIFSLSPSEIKVDGVKIPNPELVSNPTSEDLIDFIKFLGYNDALPRLSDFKRKNIPPVWNVLITILVKCLSGKTGSQDQANSRFLTMLYGIYYNLPLDFADLIFQEMKFAVKNKSRNKALSYPRFLSILISRGIKMLKAPLEQPMWKQHILTTYRQTIDKVGYTSPRPLSRYMLNLIPLPSPLLTSYKSSPGFLAQRSPTQS